MKKNKYYNFLYIFVFISSLIMTITTIFVYYKNEVNNISKVDIKKVNLLINYDKTSVISLNNLPYNFNNNYTFSIQNFSKDVVGKYKVIFEIITPGSNVVDENLVYTLSSSSKSNDSTNITVSKNETPIPIVNKELGVGVITPGNTHEYTLNIKLKNSKTNYLISSSVVASIKIENESD